ncbi:MAG: S9 family peptidase, partial [Chlorobi bacterium]|nr:S9 family peptidase [Chlorobiota bacterium]
LFEVYLDGEMIASKYSADKKKKDKGKASKSIETELGKHTLIIKALYSGKCELKRFIAAEIKLDQDFEAADLSISISPERTMRVQDIYAGTKISSARISPEGSMTMLRFKRWLPDDKSETWTEIRNIASGKTIKSFRRSKVHSLTWGNDDKTIMYKASSNKKQSLFLFNLKTNIETPVLENIDKLGACYLSPDNNFVVYSIKLKADDETAAMLRTYGMQDRWPGFRDRNFLYKVDIASGQKRQLTFGRQSTDIHDISPDSKRILFSTSTPDYIERPFDKQDMYILTIDNMKLETLWGNKRFSVSASFSPDGKELLLTGGPSAFGKTGENIGSQKIANNYDMQLYIYDLAGKKVTPITKNFNPSVKGSFWSQVDNNIYILGQDETYYRLFKYDVQSQTMSNIESGADVCGSFSVAAKKLAACYTGVSMTSPRKAFSIDLTNNQFKIIADPAKETYKNVKFGQTENWDFKNKDGVRIEGRVYYPPNYDKSKKYPLIVYYYGGTSPVSRSFGGRYPFNIYTANGYIVYVLQPSGATGFGQEFSAAHVNNWGLTVADEIIKGTKEFLTAHTSADPTKVGCIGASYGGFMTMLLQTRTDIYAAAISHAGISSISSYWGEGWWGYAYSAEASADSYPWNNRKLYVDQSPLFNADKVKTPIMLLHGTADTNVPIGES